MARIDESGHPAPDILERLAPSLRRFARALAGGRIGTAQADALASQALETSRRLGGLTEADLRLSLYASVIQFNRRRCVASCGEAEPPRRVLRGGMAQDVARLPLDEREALLLVVLEQFSYAQAAGILGLPRSSLVARLARARATLAGCTADPAPRVAHLRVVK